MIVKDGRAWALAAMFACMLTGGASAQTWPSRNITLIVPFAAGGGTDAFARPLAQHLDNLLGQRVIVENRAGAGGTAGASAAARAEPDGYTFFMGAAHHAIGPSIYPKLSYDIEKDFIPIALVSRPPHVVVVHPARVKATTLSELVAAAKAEPDKFVYGHAGSGTTHHLAGELFKLVTGAPIRQVPYRGAGPAMADLVSAQIDMMFDGLGSSAAQIEGKTIRPLAVAAPQRVPAFPDVPTAKEAGVDNFEVATWYGLFAPKGTPPAVIERMTKEVKAALATPAIRDAWAKNGSDIPDVSGQAFADHLAAEVKRWRKVVTDANVKVE